MLILSCASTAHISVALSTLRLQVTCLPEPTNCILLKIQEGFSSIFLTIFRIYDGLFSIQNLMNKVQPILQQKKKKVKYINPEGTWILYQTITMPNAGVSKRSYNYTPIFLFCQEKVKFGCFKLKGIANTNYHISI